MSPTCNASSEIQHFEHRDVIERHDGIIFDFYTGPPHTEWTTVRSSLTPTIYHSNDEHSTDPTGHDPVKQLHNSTPCLLLKAAEHLQLDYCHLSTAVQAEDTVTWTGRGATIIPTDKNSFESKLTLMQSD